MEFMEFECTWKTKRNNEKWKGRIVDVKKYGSHYEIRVESRSSLNIIYGKTSSGGFACLPDFRVGCHLVSINDRFWNREKLVHVLGDVDGITVEAALFEYFCVF